MLVDVKSYVVMFRNTLLWVVYVCWFAFALAKHALSKHENVVELKRESNNAKREVIQLSNRLKEVNGELLRSEKK